MNNRAKYLAVDEEKNNRIQHVRECFSIIYDEIHHYEGKEEFIFSIITLSAVKYSI